MAGGCIGRSNIGRIQQSALELSSRPDKGPTDFKLLNTGVVETREEIRNRVENAAKKLSELKPFEFFE